MASTLAAISVAQAVPVSKHELWQQRIEAWQASGLSQKAWCQREQVPLSSLGYWRKRLRTEESVDGDDTPRFIPVSLTEPGSLLTIRLGNQVTIEVGAGIDRGLLGDLIAALRAEA